HAIGPEAVLHKPVSGLEADANEVVEVVIWKPLDIQVDRRALDLQFGATDDVDLSFTNRQSFQGMMILLTLGSESPWPSTRPKGVGKLGDGKDALAVELLSFLRCHS